VSVPALPLNVSGSMPETNRSLPSPPTTMLPETVTSVRSAVSPPAPRLTSHRPSPASVTTSLRSSGSTLRSGETGLTVHVTTVSSVSSGCSQAPLGVMVTASSISIVVPLFVSVTTLVTPGTPS
jgi:hypothetical protein